MKRRIYSGWELVRLQKEIEEVLAACSISPAAEHAAWSPSVDILEHPERFVVRVDLPGVDASTISVETSEQVLTIAGRKGGEHRQPSAQARRYHTVERRVGRFDLEIWLPGPVARQNSRAFLRKGVLEVWLDRIPERRNSVHKIEVRDEET
jgi:HSP20 family protein